MPAPHDLFISHSSSDVAVARELRDVLEGAGYSCWMAPDNVTGTDTWAQQILAAIEGCRAMLVLISTRSNQSAHVSREVELANSRRRAVIPVRVEGIGAAGALEYHITGMQRIDAFPPPIASHRDAILRRLALTVPLADVGASMPTAAPGPVRVAERPRTATHPRRGLSAFARANSMLAGAAVTLVALFVVAAISFGMNAGAGSSPRPTGTAIAAASPTSLPTATVATRSSGPQSTPVGFPTSSGGAFPDAAEATLFAALPEFAVSVIEDCERLASRDESAVVGIECYADNGELLFYEGYPDLATQRKAYLGHVRSAMDGPHGDCASALAGDAPWSRPEAAGGYLACSVDDVFGTRFHWTDEARLVTVSWYGDTKANPDAEHAKGYELFLDWTGLRP